MAISGQENTVSPPVGLDFVEFMDWLDEDVRAEWIDGEIVMTSPASRPHQEIVKFLTRVLGTYVEEKGLGVLLPPPFVMKLEGAASEPDLLFASKEHEDRVKNTYIDGPADLMVEVISPESQGRDRFDKFQEYEKNGVREYWMIDPRTQTAEFYVHREGQYTQVAPEEDQYESEVLKGLTFRVSWLWQDPLPPLLDVVDELGLRPR